MLTKRPPSIHRTKTRRYTERSVVDGQVDSTSGIIRGVKIIGNKSVNGRRYPPKVLRQATHKYEGSKVYLNHPDAKDGMFDRPFGDWVGVVRNVRSKSDGLYGDIHLRQKGEHFESILEAAESFSECFGLSHVADCKSKFRDGVEEISEIIEIFSVDLVTDPATTEGLFESKGRSLAGRRLELAERRLAFLEAETRHLQKNGHAGVFCATLYKKRWNRRLEAARRYRPPSSGKELLK